LTPLGRREHQHLGRRQRASVEIGYRGGVGHRFIKQSHEAKSKGL